MQSPHHNLLTLLAICWLCAPCWAQRVQFPQDPNGLRPITGAATPGTGTPAMVPINPATQSGIYPSGGYGSPTFDPYASGGASVPLSQSVYNPASPYNPAAVAPNAYNPNAMAPAGTYPMGGYPPYTGAPPSLPGGGQSGTVGSFPNTGPGFSQPGVYPNNSPSALFPGPSYGNGGSSWFGDMYNSVFGNPNSGFGGAYQPGQPGYPAGVYPPAGAGAYPNTWNPQGTIFSGQNSYPQIIRFFQGPRFRHAFVYGNEDPDSLMINDSDLSLAFAIPNFFYSTQPLYLLPSFSLHQWAGPRPPSTADLPALAYSAFLDAGWQSDPVRILGAELGLRVGMFSDFNTATSDSLRIQGRGIGRLRLTPRATLKGGVIYLDRNKVKLLPAGGLLWQPNPDTRFDLFFPEPKLAHYLSTIGTYDTWWYLAGYYGGGSWTIERDSGATDSIDINDLRAVLGLEWGRNEQMRDGRRIGFLEVGYVFNRELLYKDSPLDNLDLQDMIMVRAGIGY